MAAHQRSSVCASAHVLLLVVVALALAPNAVQACTRILFTGANNTVITGRSLDWAEDTFPSLWAMPRGIKRDGAVGAGSIKWTAKYGSLVVSMYDMGTLDGINDKGLVANTLYLAESNYGKLNGKPGLTITAWAQYVLDSYATVKEAIDALRLEPFRIVAPLLPDGRPAQGHLSLADPTGDSAIIEYIDGKQVIHHGPQYRVMTNSPTYDQQLAIEQYWKSVGGQAFLPGTSRAADRFVRASYLLASIPRDVDKNIITAVPGRSFQFQAIASVRSVMQAVSVPLGIKDPNKPNIASTFWRTVIDLKHKVLVYDSATSPNTFWVVLKDLDLSAGAPIKQLPLTADYTYAGNAAAQFKKATPFKFLGTAAR